MIQLDNHPKIENTILVKFIDKMKDKIKVVLKQKQFKSI